MTQNDFLIQKTAYVPRDDAAAFDDLHPEHGAWTWFVRECLSRYVGLSGRTPGEDIDEVVDSLWEDHKKKVRHRNED